MVAQIFERGCMPVVIFSNKKTNTKHNIRFSCDY